MADTSALASAAGQQHAAAAEREWRFGAIAWTLIGAHVVLRTWIVSRAWFRQDDFYFLYRLSRDPLEWELLVTRHDGHVMPGSILLTWALRALAPGAWWPFVAATGLMLLVAAALVWRMLEVLFGRRPMALVLLAMYLGSAITLSSIVWWSSAMQFVPLQIGTAAMVLLTVRAQRSGRPRDDLLPAVALAATLCFFERGLVAGAFVVILIAAAQLTPDAPGTTIGRLRAARRQIAAMAAVGVTYLIVYSLLPLNAPGIGAFDLGEIRRIMLPVLVRSALPGLLGGPLDWRVPSVVPDTPLVEPSDLFATLVVICFLVMVAVSVARRAGAGRYWAILLGLLALDVAIMSFGRVNDIIPWIEFQPRYIAAVLLPGVLLIGLAFRGRSTRTSPQIDLVASWLARHPRLPRLGAVSAIVATLLVGGVSTIRVLGPHSVSASRDYVAASMESARAYGLPLRVLPQPLPGEVMGLGAFQYNNTEVLFEGLDRPFVFPDAVDSFYVFGNDGRIVLGEVGASSKGAGDGGACLADVGAGRTERIPLTNPLFSWAWFATIQYRSPTPGFATVTLGDSTATVPVQPGGMSVTFQLTGAGDHVVVANGGAAPLCVSDLTVGLPVTAP